MTKHAFLFGLVSLGFFLSDLPGEGATGSNDEWTQRVLKEAEAFSRTGRYDLASRRCTLLLKVDPSNKAARAQFEEIKREMAAGQIIRPTYPPQYAGPVPRS